ncbi:hypothetical protein CLOM_g17483 [Closterium sp. NIES-68]|nr:hypothetical protein CLOM_g17483 [Closterium sp. NIES-68]GJP59499.1 hypothetical protein CLOP_g12283 [Closterium sp. NIES-67]GJP85182.1 hypothetical protein CLOP_g15291 [Closterium sp. NIES-67]
MYGRIDTHVQVHLKMDVDKLLEASRVGEDEFQQVVPCMEAHCADVFGSSHSNASQSRLPPNQPQEQLPQLQQPQVQHRQQRQQQQQHHHQCQQQHQQKHEQQ